MIDLTEAEKAEMDRFIAYLETLARAMCGLEIFPEVYKSQIRRNQIENNTDAN